MLPTIHYYATSDINYTLPESASWKTPVDNAKKDGMNTAVDNNNSHGAGLMYNINSLNGVSTFYNIERTVTNVNDIKEGLNCEYDMGEESRWYFYKGGKKVYELKKISLNLENYWKAYAIPSGELLFCSKLNDSSKAYGKGYVYKNGEIEKVVIFEDDKEVALLKQFEGNQMMEFNANGQIVYDGEFLNTIDSDYARNGRGSEYKGGKILYEGYWVDGKREGYGVSYKMGYAYYVGQWSDNLPHGEGKILDKSEVKYEGDWINGKLDLEDETHYDFYEDRINQGWVRQHEANGVDAYECGMHISLFFIYFPLMIIFLLFILLEYS